jgi:sialic acid synthase SpsE
MFIIAEIGVNHYDIAKQREITILEAAKLCAFEAKKAGADAAKYQTYKSEKLASKVSPAYWDLNEEKTDSQYKLFKNFDKFTNSDWIELSSYCNKIGIEFMSTAFDLESVDLLIGLQKYWKISSSDITNYPLVEKISKQKGKILLSTGASNINDIKECVNLITKNNKNLVIMHCILNYPTPNKNANLNMITDIKNNFSEYEIGYSDHTRPDKNMVITTAGYLLGAKYIEKHFTLDKTIKGNDHYHSMDPNDLKILRNNSNLLNECMGLKHKVCIPSEKNSQNNARRSIYTTFPLKKNTILTKDNLICKRPYIGGICSTKFNTLLGKKINKSVTDDYQLTLNDIY